MKPVIANISLDKLDVSLADLVRTAVHHDVVDQYAEAMTAGDELPPVEVFSGGAQCYLADGKHRCHAAKKLGQKEIRARIHRFRTAPQAYEMAVRYAASANATHGLPRSAADKRAAVRMIISRPEYAAASDSEIARLCRVGHILVRLVREEMTAAGELSGPASADQRDYKPQARLRGGSVADGRGGLVSSLEPQAVARPNPVAGPERGVEDAQDAGGWVPPSDYQAHFERGRALVRDVTELVSKLRGRIATSAYEPGGEAVSNLLSVIDRQLEQIQGDIADSVPYALCPNRGCAKKDRCTVCRGRGWVTRHIYRQLPNELQQQCVVVSEGRS